jgi:hypothetical protein
LSNDTSSNSSSSNSSLSNFFSSNDTSLNPSSSSFYNVELLQHRTPLRRTIFLLNFSLRQIIKLIRRHISMPLVPTYFYQAYFWAIFEVRPAYGRTGPPAPPNPTGNPNFDTQK